MTYELLYILYFYINDYETACNFWFLNKYFTKNYMNIYNKNYEHKYKLLTKQLDSMLKTIHEGNINDKLVINKLNYCNDIKFCYKLYKTSLIDQFIKCDFDYNRQCSWCSLLIYYIFHEGTDILTKIYDIKCVKNKIILIPRFIKKQDLMQFLTYLNKTNGYCIKRYSKDIEDVLT
jgi:hypothetical protein